MEKVASLQELYGRLAILSMEAGWNKSAPSLWPEPRTNFVPHRWRYPDAKHALDAAGQLISTELAERRNLVLFNPVQGNVYATVRTMVSAYQMVMPGEQARSHRHTPNALRLVLEAEPGSYTVVDGAKLTMAPGDVLLTPSWAWHGHGNESKAPAYWLDFLDVPLVQLLEPMFFEPHPQHYEPVTSEPKASPFIFPWSETRRRLNKVPEIQLRNRAMQTIALSMLRVDPGVPTKCLRTTANNIYAVMEGEGETVIDGQWFDWQRGDLLVAPSWRPHYHRSAAGAVLFRCTDEPVMRRLGFLRSQAAS